jgi:predicted CoA-binding protein
MGHPNIIEDEGLLGGIVRGMRTVAVVGMKDERRADEAAFAIPALVHARGCEVIPINPTIASALGVPSLPAVSALQRRVDVLDVFRRSDRLPALADEILALPEERRPDVVWLQSGIRHEAAAERLAAAGIKVVQDRCLGVYVSRYRRR